MKELPYPFTQFNNLYISSIALDTLLNIHTLSQSFIVEYSSLEDHLLSSDEAIAIFVYPLDNKEEVDDFDCLFDSDRYYIFLGYIDPRYCSESFKLSFHIALEDWYFSNKLLNI